MTSWRKVHFFLSSESSKLVPKDCVILSDSFRFTIIDEADEMVSTDWVDDMAKIMGGGGTIILDRMGDINAN